MHLYIYANIHHDKRIYFPIIFMFRHTQCSHAKTCMDINFSRDTNMFFRHTRVQIPSHQLSGLKTVLAVAKRLNSHAWAKSWLPLFFSSHCLVGSKTLLVSKAKVRRASVITFNVGERHPEIARTQSTLHQLLHLLQHLASQRGLHINPDKCQLLRLNSTLPICLSCSTSPTSCCSCCFCSDFTTLTPTENSLADPLPVVDTAKYLGAMISANSSSNADVAYRYSQAAAAFRCLFPVFTHPQIQPKRKLQIYAQIVMAILLHGSESQVYTPAQITKLNSLHYKVLRQILQIKSSYYHRVLDPSSADCSNHFLLQQAFAQVPGLLLPSQLMSKNRLKYLGHILRHPTCIEHHLCFNNSLSLRTISSPFRRGAPRAHWPEIGPSRISISSKLSFQ